MKRLIFVLLTLPSVTLAIDPKLVPDPLYAPKPGDLCTIGMFDTKSKSCYDVDASKDYGSHTEYCQALLDKDEDAIGRLYAAEYVIELEAGTRVELLRVVEYSAKDPRPESAYVRPDEGPWKNRYFWIARDELLRRVGVAKPFVDDPRPTAASLLKWGKRMDGADRTTSALGYYRRLVKEFPATPEATIAAARVQALTDAK